MRIRPIAAGDSLVWTARVPAEAGDLSAATFEVIAERSDGGATVRGAVSSVNTDARTVIVQIPAGELTPGLWRVQARVSGLDQVLTFVLDAILDVLRSLLPLPTRTQRATLVLPRLRVAADGSGLRSQASGVLMLPRLGASAEGPGPLPVVYTEIVIPRLTATAAGSSVSTASADVALPALGASADGQGQQFVATADMRMAALGASGLGSGALGEGTADIRIPGLGGEADGPGFLPQAQADVRLFGFTASATGDSQAPAPPAGPSEAEATYGPGDAPGEIDLSITGAPSSAGDENYGGDGLGAITAYRSRIAGVVVEHNTTTLPINRTATSLPEGVQALVEWWALGSNGIEGAISSANVSPAAAPTAPSAPDATAGPGENAGEVAMAIIAPPMAWGDAVVAGDGLGEITGYRSRITGVEVEHNTTTLPINRTAAGLAEGVAVLAEAWALGTDGRPGAIWSEFVFPAVTAPAGSIGLVDQATGRGLVDQISGRGIVIPALAED